MQRIGVPFAFFSAVVSLFFLESQATASTPQGWKAELPSRVGMSADWQSLAGELVVSELYFGALAAAQRMLLYFPDAVTKDSAYRTLVQSIRGGYPFPVHALFREADLQPDRQDEFSNAYFTYKGIVQESAGVERWSQNSFLRVEAEKTPEYLFYSGLKAYRAKEHGSALGFFSKILDMETSSARRPLKIHAARTVARIWFEEEQYEKSIEIYVSFLLKLNPMFPSDWLEAAWNLFYLKRYSEALSFLYNLESPSSHSVLLFEKYMLRGLIYKQLCAERELAHLQLQFKQIFGLAIQGIKKGMPLTAFPFLKLIQTSGDSEYNRLTRVLSGLRTEMGYLKRLRHGGLAQHLYLTEVNHLEKLREFFGNEHLSQAAERLILTDESLSFLRFEMQRTQVDPDKVFASEREESVPALRASSRASTESSLQPEITIAWRQNGDFWRSERLAFTARIQDQCRR